MQSSPKKSSIASMLDHFNNDDFDFKLLTSFFKRFRQEDPPIPKPEINCAVFKGGGVKVIGYIGVMQAMQSKGLIDDLDYVAGTSGGAIYALMLALGFDGNQILRMFEYFDLADTTDKRDSVLGNSFAGTMASQVMSMLFEGKVYSGDNLRRWARGLLKHVIGNPDATFADLHELKKEHPTFKDPYFLATRLRAKSDQSQEVVFGYNRYPDVKIVDVFCATLAFPTVYPPVKVHEKQEDGKFKSIGLFNDGGVFNNFPISVFDSRCFVSKHYLPEYRAFKDITSQFPVNPCSLGFSLVEDFSKLDENLTPFTKRLKKLREENSNMQVQRETDESHESWSVGDLIKQIWSWKWGTPKREEIDKKYITHPENVVQIWAEDVNTIEFNLSKEKRDNIVESGRKAFLHWYKKFRDPSATYDPSLYIKRPPLTRREELLRRTDRKQYYIEIVAEKLETLYRTLERYQYLSDDEINSHTKLINLCATIDDLLIDKLEPLGNLQGSLESAYNLAHARLTTRHQKIVRDRIHLNALLHDHTMAEFYQNLLTTKPFKSEQLIESLKEQLTKSVYYCLESKSNVLGLAAQYNISALPDLMSFLEEKTSHYKQLGKGFKYPTKTLINEVPPYPVLFCANKNVSQPGQAIEQCLKIGFDPTKTYKLKTPIHHAIELGNVAATAKYLSYVRQHDIPLKSFNYGYEQLPLAHYMFATGGMKFIKQLEAYDGGKLFGWLISKTPSNLAQISIFEQAAMVCDKTYWDHLNWRYGVIWQNSSHIESQVQFGKKACNYVDDGIILKNILLITDQDNCKKLINENKAQVLSLLGDNTINNILVLAVIRNRYYLIENLLNELIEQGLDHLLRATMNLEVKGKKISEHIKGLKNNTSKTLLQNWFNEPKDVPLIKTQTTLKIAQPSNNRGLMNRLRRIILTGSEKQFRLCLKIIDTFGLGWLRKCLNSLDLAHKSALHYMVDAQRGDLLKCLNEFLKSKDVQLDEMIEQKELNGNQNLFKYAQTRNTQFLDQLNAIIDRPQDDMASEDRMSISL